MPKRGFELKIERALKHLDCLDSSIKGWLEVDAYTIREEPQANSGQKVLSVEPKNPIPSDFQLLIGDCVHNLRSALDLLAFDLAWAGSRGPMTQAVAERSGFPVFGSRAPQASELRQRIGAVDPTAQAIIEELQPYKREAGFEADNLWILHQLWNQDKHRGLPLTLLAVMGHEIGRPGESGTIKNLTGMGGGPIRRKTKLMSYELVLGPNDHMDMKGAPIFDVALGQGTPAQGIAVVPLLTSLKDYVVNEIVVPLQKFI
jgi:hypothetical protein